MKTLKDEVSLIGKVETISMTEFRTRPGDVIDQVCLGKTFNITKVGKTVAVLSRPQPTALEIGAEVRRLGLLCGEKDSPND